MNASVVLSLLVSLVLAATIDGAELAEKRGPRRYHRHRPSHHHRRPSGPPPTEGGVVLVEDGESQSPVNIATCDAIPKCMPLLFLLNYGAEREGLTLTNDGYKAELTCSEEKQTDKIPSISGGPLPVGEAFVLNRIYLRWGADNSAGTEHAINDKTYDMELQLVHYNSKFASFEEAEATPGAIAIMSVLYKISTSDNENLAPIMESAQEVMTGKSSTTLINAIKLESLLPKSKQSYYTYEGSLTEEPFTESVIWIVFKNFASISASQIEELRAMQAEDGTPLSDVSIRTIQSLNKRRVHLAMKC